MGSAPRADTAMSTTMVDSSTDPNVPPQSLPSPTGMDRDSAVTVVASAPHPEPALSTTMKGSVSDLQFDSGVSPRDLRFPIENKHDSPLAPMAPDPESPAVSPFVAVNQIYDHMPSTPPAPHIEAHDSSLAPMTPDPEPPAASPFVTVNQLHDHMPIMSPAPHTEEQGSPLAPIAPGSESPAASQSTAIDQIHDQMPIIPPAPYTGTRRDQYGRVY
jgi:hypothetical protein